MNEGASMRTILRPFRAGLLQSGLCIGLLIGALCAISHPSFAGDKQNPEISDRSGDQASPGDATQDVVAAWVQQQDNSHLLFAIQVSGLSGVNANSGQGLMSQGMWRFYFSLTQ